MEYCYVGTSRESKGPVPVETLRELYHRTCAVGWDTGRGGCPLTAALPQAVR